MMSFSSLGPVAPGRGMPRGFLGRDLIDNPPAYCEFKRRPRLIRKGASVGQQAGQGECTCWVPP